jgi:hypothetical protein
MTTSTVRPKKQRTDAATVTARREIIVFLVLQVGFLATSGTAVAEGVNVRRIDEANALGQASPRR